MTTLSQRVAAVRRFSRFYTRRIGLLSEGILDSEFSLTEARVLYELANSDESLPTGIAADLELDPGYVSRVLTAFEKRGLLTRTRSRTDRRCILLELTAAGRAAYERLNSGSRSQIERLLTRAPAEDQERLVEAMASIERILGGQENAPTVTYRPHRPGDMGWIVQRHGELYHESHGWDVRFEAMVAGIVEGLVDNYDPGWERCWIAEVDGRRAGAIALVRHAESVAQLRLLFVEPFARGLGIGTRLVSECVGHARHVGYQRMVLFTVEGLDAARRLYEGEGFALTAEKPTHEWGRDQVAQTWELEL